MPDSRVAALLRSRGVGTPRLSEREAARRCGVSPQTMNKVMRGITRGIRRSTLDQIADGLGIPRDLLERESLADAGYIQAASGSTVAEALALIQDLSPHDLALVQIAIGQMQQARAEADQEMRGASTSTE